MLGTLDFSEPVGVLCVCALHFVPDEEKPHQIIAEYRDHLAPGSYLAITHGINAPTPEDDPDGVVESVTNVYQNASAQIHVRSTKEIERFFDGFEIIEPGVVWMADWRPDPGTRPAGRQDSLHGGVGRKPAPWPRARRNVGALAAGELAGEFAGGPRARELLAAQPLARLAYTGPDGFPRVIPIGFHWASGQIIVCTVPSSPKVRALSARPHVALTIDTDDGPASRALFIRGVASIDVVDGVPGEYLAAATKAMDTEQARSFEAHVRAIYKQMARITIQPRWARYYDFGAGRVPEFLQKLGQ